MRKVEVAKEHPTTRLPRDVDPSRVPEDVHFILMQVRGHGDLARVTHANHQDDSGMLVVSGQQLF